MRLHISSKVRAQSSESAHPVDRLRAHARARRRRTISRRITFPLSQANHRRQAALVIEHGELRMFHSKERAREYLYRNIDAILAAYGSTHKLKKEDVSDWPGSAGS